MNTTDLSQLRIDTKRLLALLHRGGRYAHLWTDGGHRSYWFRVDGLGYRNGRRPRPRRVPKPWLRHNVYFTLHPLSQIPPHNTNGNTDRRYISSQTGYICAVNTLFAEFDGKDYVYSLEYNGLLPDDYQSHDPVAQQQLRQSAKETLFYRMPERFKRRALRHIESLHFPPSVIVDSGGGYHCYWLLRKTVPIDESNRNDVEVIQHGWVQMVQGDPGAADLRRVLRLPGSYNHKAGFGDQPPRVHFVKREFGLLYSYQELEEAVNEWLYTEELRQRGRAAWRQRWRQRQQQIFAQAATGATSSMGNTPNVDDNPETARRRQLRQEFNRSHSIQKLLMAHGYQLSYDGDDQIRLARPGRGRRHSSVTIFPAQGENSFERSIHFSTNDPLYSREYVDKTTGKLRRQVHDAFAVYTQLEHQGNWEAAYRAVAPLTPTSIQSSA